MSPKQLWYTLDHNDVISAVHPEWDAFARENGASEGALARTVIGRKLWDFITQGDVTAIYKKAIAQARKNGVYGNIPFVCNSPTTIRHVEFSATVMPTGMVLVLNTMLSMSPRQSKERMHFYEGASKDCKCGFCEALVMAKTRLYSENGRSMFNKKSTPLKEVCSACKDRIARTLRTDAYFDRKKANINFPPVT
jgi:hypothetical protein